MSHTTNERIRIIAAIARKDILDALRNRTLLALMIGTATLLMTAQIGPLISRLMQPNAIILYSPEAAPWIETVRENDCLRILQVDHRATLETVLLEDQETRIGIEVPAGYDPSSGEALPVIATHWASDARLSKTISFVEAEFTRSLGTLVTLELQEERLYPPADAGGNLAMAAMTFVLTLTILGAVFTPTLMVEEMRTGTLKALLVSPARHADILFGEALTGVVYLLLCGAIVLGLHNRLIASWGPALAALVGTTLLVVSIGLLLGVFFDDAMSINAVAGPLLVLLLAPLFIKLAAPDRVPAWLEAVFYALPSTRAAHLYQSAFTLSPPLAGILADSAVLLLYTIFFLVLAILGVRWRAR
ncbi:MAG: ABC transporter permease [Anaerolineales bacterium]|nr:ABC transporter permease [Anaerolineales bacterium]